MTTSYNAQDMAIQLDDIQSSVAAMRAGETDLFDSLQETNSLLQSVAHLLGKTCGLKDINAAATISPSAITLDRAGRRYLLIFTPVAITGITVNSIGVTGYTLNLSPGWTPLIFPDGTTLTGPSGTSQIVIIKATNYYQGNVI